MNIRLIIEEELDNAIKLNDEIINFVSKFNTSEELLKSGGIPIDMLDNLAFGFTEDSIKQLDPNVLKIEWKDDLENVKYEIKKSGLLPKQWALKIDLSEPIDVEYKKVKNKLGFYIQDGHHRYSAAKILNKPLNVNLEIKYNPIIAISPNLGYDEFHRLIFNQVKSLNEDDKINNSNNTTMKFYHGGNLENIDSDYVFKTKKMEFGAGLYLTNDYRVVQKYTRGSRKLYLVEVYKGTDINDVQLDYNYVINFLKKLIGGNISKILPYLEKRNEGGKIEMIIVNNLLFNYNLIKGQKTRQLVNFYVNNGIDYEITENSFGFGDKMMILYNTNKIKSIKKLNWKTDDIPEKLK